MSEENSTKINKNTVISSLIWKFLERGGVQGVQFILSIVLARLVSPDDYGVIALILVFIQIATVFIQSGFNTALIQKKESEIINFYKYIPIIHSLCSLKLYDLIKMDR